MSRTISTIAVMTILGTPVFAQENLCIKHAKAATIVADFQTASLLCPKWKVVVRADYFHLLIDYGVLGAGSFVKVEEDKAGTGYVKLTKQCQQELLEVEFKSIEKARRAGLENFCIQMSRYLVNPDYRFDLERNGFFPGPGFQD